MEEAPPILRAAIDEARACGAHDVERMAIHDLGVATQLLGDSRGGMALVEESMDLARAANDRFLLTRCYNNIPAIMSGNGETNERIMPIMVEGLDRARRSMNHAAVSWMTQNIADLLGFQGRTAEAVPYIEEAIAAARTLGDVSRIGQCLAQRAYARLFIGDREGARAGLAESREALIVAEPQATLYYTVFDAVFMWPDDPIEACRLLFAALQLPDIALPPLLDAAPIVARMALRTGDAPSLGGSVGIFLESAARCSGPVRALQRRWLEALTSEPAAGSVALQGVAEEFEAIDYRLPAADAFADAALLARRAGLDPTADETASRRLYAASGVVPPLGELPETRWVGAAETAARPA